MRNKMFAVSYGHPLYKTIIVAAKCSMDAFKRADDYVRKTLHDTPDGVQSTCFTIYEDVKIIL